VTDASTDLDLRLNAAQRQYEAWSGDDLAGRVEFRLADGVIVFTHTLVGERYQGRGIATRLIAYALDDVRSRGDRSVVPRCPMVKAWIDRHDDYRDLVTAGNGHARGGRPSAES
jgi:predicted GNAT family acetyltransferase